MGVTQLKIQTVDYVGTPTQTNILKAIHFIQDSNSRQESVYVHCKAGRTRSATVVACYLMHVRFFNSIDPSIPSQVKPKSLNW